MKIRPGRIVLIAKPTDSAIVKELRAAVSWLRDHDYIVHPRLTFDDDDALRFARSATLRGADLIIAAGGDGTVNQIVNGMMGARTARTPRLAVIPLGTANDFAKGLQIPTDVHAATELAVRGTPVQVDVASVNQQCFVNVSTGGFGPDITEDASSKSKARFGKLAYLFTAVRKLAELDPARAVFESDGKVVYDGPFFFFAVGNARHTGGGTPVTPRADYSDALLDFVLVTGDKRRDFLTLLPDLRAGKHTDDPDVLYLRTRSLRVRALEPFAVNADGEPLRAPQFVYRLLGKQLEVMRAFDQ
jgi:diacylglycerol kinase (ATP)